MLFLESLFKYVLLTSWNCSIIIILIFIIQKCIGQKLGYRFRCLLWLLVFFKMFIPIMPQSHLSIFNFLPTSFHTATNYLLTSEKKAIPITPSQGATTALGKQQQINKNNSEQTLFHFSTNTDLTQTSTHHASNNHYSLFSITSILWLLCMILLIINFIAFLCIFKCKEKKECKDEVVQQALTYSKSILQIHRPIKILEISNLYSPLLGGWLIPTIYLPKNLTQNTSFEELHYILTHELVHWKRKDSLCNTFGLIAVCIHWFNPLVWLAVKMMRADREFACDMNVLEVLGEQHAPSYGSTILKLATLYTKSNNKIFYKTAFCENKKQIKRRIIMINQFNSGKTHKITLGALMVYICLGSVTLSSAAPQSLSTSSPILSNATYTTPSEFQLISDPTYQYFDRLDRLAKYADFNFKVPNVAAQGAKCTDMRLDKNPSTDNTVISMFYSINTSSSSGSYELLISQNSLIDYLQNMRANKDYLPKAIVSFKQEPMQIGTISGVRCQINRKDKPGNPTGPGQKEKEDIDSYFIWKQDNTWYAFKYSQVMLMKDKTLTLLKLSADELAPVIASLKSPTEITSTLYNTGKTNKPFYAVYDEDDLARIYTDFGFKPILPLELPGIKATEANMSGDTLFRPEALDSEYIEMPLFSIEYKSPNSTSRHSIEYCQTSSLARYEDAKKLYDKQTSKPSTSNSWTLHSIEGIQVYCYTTKENNTTSLYYVWPYNHINFPTDEVDSQAIVKAIIQQQKSK